MTEEDIKAKVILPYLTDLGFDVSEISLEKSFTIRIGKTQKTINGRADILCKSNDKNLFIIELKSDSIKISENDIKQGISYARALEDNIAPFTIITSAKSTKIFDSISGLELSGTTISSQSDFWKNGCKLSIAEELSIRYDALINFVSFTPDNLELVCNKQVFDRMGTIAGTIDKPYAKYIKELYYQREGLQHSFNGFVNSDAKAFGLVGNAGVGKTNSICSLALQNLGNCFVLFYNATVIDSPIECISQDLNIPFSSKIDKEKVLKKLDELGRRINKNVLIFIDAIDECRNISVSNELSEIALIIRNLGKVKICISCKSNIWESILKRNDTPNYLYEELKKYHDINSALNNLPGFLLEDFTEEELNCLIHLYKKAFNFKGSFSETLLKELRNGFFLRIFSEVYANEQIPETINDKDLIKRYIQQSFEKASINKANGIRTLSEIGKVLLNHKYSTTEAYYDEGVNVTDLLDKLNYSIDENIPECYFSRNILIKSSNEESYDISFYYSKIRDYIICYYSYKLDKLKDNEFYDNLEIFYQNYIGISAISFYIDNASYSHKNILTKFIKDKALVYANSYDTFLNKNFANFKDKFDPYTNNEIGIILPQDILKQDGYALFPMQCDVKDKILYEDLKNPFSESYDRDVLIKKGVKTVYGSYNSLMVSDQNKIIKKNIFKRLNELIREGCLSAYNSDILLLEQLSAIIYFYYQKLDYEFNIKDFSLPRFELIYPIDLLNLKNRLYKYNATIYYNRNNVPRNLIKEKVEEAIKNKIDIPIFKITGDTPPFEELFKIVNILLEKGYDMISKHHLPYPDKSIIEIKAFYEVNRKENLNQIRTFQYSENQAKLYIESFLTHLENSYKEFVENLFPTLKDDFPFYKTIPHDYFFYMKDSNIIEWGLFGYRASEKSEICINIKDFNSNDDAFNKDKILSLRAFSLDSFLYNSYIYKIKTIDKIKTPKVDDFCVIRNWIYRFLKDDMEEIFKENKD